MTNLTLFSFCSSYLDLTYASTDVYFVNESITFACWSFNLNNFIYRLRFLLLFAIDRGINFWIDITIMIRTDCWSVYWHICAIIERSLHIPWVKWCTNLCVLSWPFGSYCLLKILVFALALLHVESLGEDFYFVLRHWGAWKSILHMVFNRSKVKRLWHELRRCRCIFLRSPRRYHKWVIVQELVLTATVIIMKSIRPYLDISWAFRLYSVKVWPCLILIFYWFYHNVCSCAWPI